jgi:hypothetical protein
MKLPLRLAVALALTACTTNPLPKQLENAGFCDQDAYAKLVVGYALDLVMACDPVPVEQCENDTRAAVRAKYQADFDAWEKRCVNDDN